MSMLHWPFILLAFCLIPLIVLAIMGGLVIAAIRTWRGEPLRARKEEQADETRLIQEIHQGLSNMEKRIEALETILLDRERKGKNGTQAL
jgi:phage shock protein B